MLHKVFRTVKRIDNGLLAHKKMYYIVPFFVLFQVIAFDELKTDYKNPIDQCNSLNPVGKLKKI